MGLLSSQYDDDPRTLTDEGKAVKQRMWDDAPMNPGGMSETDNALVNAILGVLGAVVGIALLPVFLLGFLPYLVLRFVRLRLRLISVGCAVISVIGIMLTMNTDWIHELVIITDVFRANGPSGALSSLKFGFIFIMVSGFKIGMAVAPWFGLLGAWYATYKMRKSPWLVEVKGVSWKYNFRYRMTPGEFLKKADNIEKMKAGKLVPHGDRTATPLGLEREPVVLPDDPGKIHPWQVVSRYDSEATRHTLITGTSGSGKTVTMFEIAKHDIDAGKTVFLIDCKKSPEFASKMALWAEQAGSDFYHFSADAPYMIQQNPSGPAYYDPLAHGDASTRTDMILSMREWDTASDVYREQAQSFLLKLFSVMEYAEDTGVLDQIPTFDNQHGEFWTFVQMLNRNTFNSVVTALSRDSSPDAEFLRRQADELNALLAPTNRSPEAKVTQQRQGAYYTQMNSLMSSSYGRWIRGSEADADAKRIDVFELANKPGNVVLFSLGSDKATDVGTLIGSMICTDLTNMTAVRMNAGQTNPVSIYIDEFQSLPPTAVSSMLQKAREAKVGLTLAFQSLDQVTAKMGTDAYVKGLLDTCSNFIFHAGSNTDTAEMMSKIIGRRKVNKYTVQKRNQEMFWRINWENDRNFAVGTQVEEDYLVSPAEFQKLNMPDRNGNPSEAIVLKKKSDDPLDADSGGQAVAHKVLMYPPREILKNIYDPHAKPVPVKALRGVRTDDREEMVPDVAPAAGARRRPSKFGSESGHDMAAINGGYMPSRGRLDMAKGPDDAAARYGRPSGDDLPAAAAGVTPPTLPSSEFEADSDFNDGSGRDSMGRPGAAARRGAPRRRPAPAPRPAYGDERSDGDGGPARGPRGAAANRGGGAPHRRRPAPVIEEDDEYQWDLGDDAALPDEEPEPAPRPERRRAAEPSRQRRAPSGGRPPRPRRAEPPEVLDTRRAPAPLPDDGDMGLDFLDDGEMPDIGFGDDDMPMPEPEPAAPAPRPADRPRRGRPRRMNIGGGQPAGSMYADLEPDPDYADAEAPLDRRKVEIPASRYRDDVRRPDSGPRHRPAEAAPPTDSLGDDVFDDVDFGFDDDQPMPGVDEPAGGAPESPRRRPKRDAGAPAHRGGQAPAGARRGKGSAPASAKRRGSAPPSAHRRGAPPKR